jgi:hypothetical protein
MYAISARRDLFTAGPAYRAVSMKPIDPSLVALLVTMATVAGGIITAVIAALFNLFGVKRTTEQTYNVKVLDTGDKVLTETLDRLTTVEMRVDGLLKVNDELRDRNVKLVEANWVLTERCETLTATCEKQTQHIAQLEQYNTELRASNNDWEQKFTALESLVKNGHGETK